MYQISVETYATAKQFHYVKVAIDGLYISGIKVCESTKHRGKLWIQMPSYRASNQWKRYIEAANDSPLGQQIYKAIEDLMTPKIFPESTSSDIAGIGGLQADTVVEDFDINEPINLDDIPF